MNELIAQKELSYAHISAALNAIGMRPEEWSKGGLIALGYSTKLIQIQIWQDSEAIRLVMHMMLDFAEGKTMIDLFNDINSANPQVFYGKLYVPQEGSVLMSYEIPLLAGITANQICTCVRKFDDAGGKVLDFLADQGYLDLERNNEAGVDISKM